MWWWLEWSSPSWCNVTELNSSNGSTNSPPGVASPLSSGTPFIALVPPPMGLLPLISTLSLSFTFLKFRVSMPCPWCGTIGGFMWRINAHWVVRKKGWVLTSEAPARAPRRRFSSLMRSLRTRDLQRLYFLAYCQQTSGERSLLCDLRCSRMFREWYIISQDIGESSISILAFEWRGSIQHLVH